jgi:hypothetical protein
MRLDTFRSVPFIFALSFAACAQEETSAPAEPPAQEASDASLRIEQAERLLDRGGDAAQARALLETTLAAPDTTLDEKSRAVLALSRAHEALGDRDKAISVVEAVLAAHGDDRNWAD